MVIYNCQEERKKKLPKKTFEKIKKGIDTQKKV